MRGSGEGWVRHLRLALPPDTVARADRRVNGDEHAGRRRVQRLSDRGALVPVGFRSLATESGGPHRRRGPSLHTGRARAARRDARYARGRSRVRHRDGDEVDRREGMTRSNAATHTRLERCSPRALVYCPAARPRPAHGRRALAPALMLTWPQCGRPARAGLDAGSRNAPTPLVGSSSRRPRRGDS